MPRTLAAVRRIFPPSVCYEIILVDGGSTDETVAIANKAGARVLGGVRGRARQLNLGATHARGRFLYFLHADTRPGTDLYAALRRAAEQNLPACCRIRFVPETTLVRCYGWLSRLKFTAFRYGDQSLFVQREVFHSVGGYREDHQLLEGNDLVRRLRRATGNFLVLPATVDSSARRYQRFGAVYVQACYVMIYGLYRLGFSQRRLKAIYARCFPGEEATKVGAARKLPSSAHSNQR